MGMGRVPKSPRQGAEDGAAAIFRPVPGLRESCGFPTAYAVGYFLPLYELDFGALQNPNSYVPHPVLPVAQARLSPSM